MVDSVYSDEIAYAAAN